MTTISYLDEDADSYAGLNGEDIFVFCLAGRKFLFFAVAMQIKHKEFVEAAHEAAAHPVEGRVIEIAMIGNEGQNTLPGPVNPPLCQSHKLHIIVAQPLRLRPFLKFRTTLFILIQQRQHPRLPVGRMPRVRRIPQHNHDWRR